MEITSTQLKDESAAAYQRYLIYRNMGLGRSLRGAWRLYQTQKGYETPQKATNSNEATNSGKGRKKAVKIRYSEHLPGQWVRDSVRFQWKKRVSTFDIERLKAAPTFYERIFKNGFK